MPIKLDEAITYNPGHGQDPVVYTCVFLCGCNTMAGAKTIILSLEYGNVSAEGAWVPGALPKKTITRKNEDAEYQSYQAKGDIIDGEWVEREDQNAPLHELVKGDLVDGNWVRRDDQSLPIGEGVLLRIDGEVRQRDVEIKAADPQFDDMRRLFVIGAEDVGEEGFDVVSDFVYQWLIDKGHYKGTIL